MLIVLIKEYIHLIGLNLLYTKYIQQHVIFVSNFRLPTVAGFSSPSLKTLVRHYSFYTQPESKSPFTARAPTAPHIPKAASLLMHTLALDIQQQESVSIMYTPLTSVFKRTAPKVPGRCTQTAFV